MKNINEELNYMKYLFGYQKGVLISEQNILLEQATKADYDAIASSLTSSYKTALEKYGFTSIELQGVGTDSFPTNEYTGEPLFVTLIGKNKVKFYDKEYGSMMAACKSGIKYKKPNEYGTKTSSTVFDDNSPFREAYVDSVTGPATAKNDAQRTKLKPAFDNTMDNISKNVCDLIKLKSEGKNQEVTEKLEAIKKVEEDQQKQNVKPAATTQQTTKPAATTQKTTTQQTTKPAATTQQTTTNPNTVKQDPIYDAPIIEVTKSGNLWKVKAFGSFPVNVKTSGLAKDFIANFTKKVFGDPVLQKTKGDIGITFARIRGGASNVQNNEAVLPEITFNASQPKNYTTYTKIDQTKLNKANYPGDLATNTELAKSRALNLFKEMKSMLPNLKNLAPDIFAEIQKNNPGTTPKINVDIEPLVEGFNVDTGGKPDKDRDVKKYPVPGQHVYMDLTVQIEPNKVKSAGCMKGFSIVVTHSPHNCDVGQYNLYINNELIGMSDVSTASLGTATNPTYAYATDGVILNKYTNNKLGDPGGVRKDTFTIPENVVAKFLAKSTKGEVRISGQEWKPGRHSDQPFFTVKNAAGTVLLNNWSPAKQPECKAEPCPKFDMVVINPCSDDPASAILGNDYGKNITNKT